ncbi:hypothetical protein D3C87_1376910 [compost metagenome]
MARLAQQRGRQAFLHLFAAHHHGHAVGPFAHHGEVVGDQQQAHVQLGAQVVQQLQDLRLHRHVQRGGGLVGHQQRGLAGDGGGDHGALPLPAGQAVRVVVHAALRLGYAHQVQQFDGAGPGRPGGRAAMQAQGLADLVAQGQHRVQAGHGLLEDHGDAVAAQRAALAFRQRQQILAFEQHAPLNAGVARQQAQQGERGGGFAAAGLADQRQGFPGADLQIQASHGLVAGEGDVQPLDVDQCSHKSLRPRSRRARPPRGAGAASD